METATLGGGCFWCLEAVFTELRGIKKVVSGYSGGTTQNPTYEKICSGTSGHAEVVQVTWDPALISLKVILEVFFATHDPTTLNRQGNDVGTQYRSVIFYQDMEQKKTAEQVLGELTGAGIWKNPIVTEIVPLEVFHPAEDYHQDYFKHNPGQGYCQVVISPKVAKFRKQFQDRLKR